MTIRSRTALASITAICLASASSSVVYDSALDTLERQLRVAGPIVGEWAETIGRGQFDFALSTPW